MVDVSPVLTAGAFAAFFAAAGASFPYLPVYFQSLGLDLPAIGAIFGATAAMRFVAAPLWGAATDHLGSYRATMLIATIVGVVAAAALANVRSLTLLVPAALSFAASQVGLQALLDARTLQQLGLQRTSYGRYRLWGSVGFIVASLAVGFLIDRYGSGSLFLVYIPATIAVGAIAASFPDVQWDRRMSVRQGAALLIRDPVLVAFLVGSLLEWGAVVGVNTYLSIDIVSLGGSAWAVGLAWTLSAAIQVPIMWFYPRLVDRFGLGLLIAAGGIVYAGRSIAYTFFSNAPALVILTTLEGVGYALFLCGSLAFVSSRAPRGFAATAQGLFAGVTQGLGGILGSTIGGLIAGSFSINALFVVAGSVGAGAAIVVTRAVRAGTQPVPSPT